MLKWIALALAVIGVDQYTKALVTSHIPLGSGIVLTPFFTLVDIRNSGAAFSLFASEPGWQRVLFIVVASIASAILLFLLHRARGKPLMATALSLILGGALGNLLDRIRLGEVVDFLYFHWGSLGWPAFNAADSAITVGAALLVWDSLRSRRR